MPLISHLSFSWPNSLHFEIKKRLCNFYLYRALLLVAPTKIALFDKNRLQINLTNIMDNLKPLAILMSDKASDNPPAPIIITYCYY